MNSLVPYKAEIVAADCATRRNFKIHPSIIKTLINEQAGSLPKAFGELVMNSVDAGATLIELDIDKTGAFTFRDNGKGFTSSTEIEEFFETFGTPHEEGDAYFARFRCGRGQIMSYARTVWRSGLFEMRVDLDGEQGEAGYDFVEHSEHFAGCCITGHIYNFQRAFEVADYELSQYFTGWSAVEDAGRGAEFGRLVRYVPVPVFVNGKQVNILPAEEKWDDVDEYAYYSFDRESHEMLVFNRGVLVTEIPSRDFGIGGVVCSKTPLAVNLARNAVLEHKCPIWKAISAAIKARFRLQLTKVRKLNDNEAASLLSTIFFSDQILDYETRRKVSKIRFIPDIFGNLRSPEDVLYAGRFTLFDGKHTGIAERVQREGLAAVIMPRLLSICRATVSEENAAKAIKQLRTRLGISTDEYCVLVPFVNFVSSLNGTHSLVEDGDLEPEELLVLECLNAVNWDIARFMKIESVRRIVVGLSDTADAWTDGVSFIAIHRKELKGIRGNGRNGWRYYEGDGGVTRLVALLVHEYCHREGSIGDHDHDYEFMVRFHDTILRPPYGAAVDTVFRRYVAGICKLGIVPSATHGAHLRGLFKYVDRLPRRVKDVSEREPSMAFADRP